MILPHLSKSNMRKLFTFNVFQDFNILYLFQVFRNTSPIFVDAFTIGVLVGSPFSINICCFILLAIDGRTSKIDL